MKQFETREDMHVHSVFSDGKGTLFANLATASERGLKRLGFVDHVRQDTTWVAEYARAVDTLRGTTEVDVQAGIEAKLLDENGNLDVPSDIAGIDRIYIADHRWPLGHGLLSPRQVRELIASGERSADELIDILILSMCRSLCAYPGSVLAHPFSILPKCHLSEELVDDQRLDVLIEVVRDTGSCIEVDERWRCPSARVVRRFLAAGVPVLTSTDSHRPETIGQYEYCATLWQEIASTRGASLL